MAFLDPYAVDGATITASQLRREVFAYTKGATGIDGPSDLRVVAVGGSPGVAGILPGGGVVAVESRRESYSVTNTAMDGDALVDVPPAGSGGATHYVIIEVTDPEFHGQEAVATPRLVSSLSGRTRPFLPLARIDLEPGETFTTTSSIEDLRQVAVPRVESHFFGWNIVTGEGSFQLTYRNDYPIGQFWPQPSEVDEARWRVYIPEWATRLDVTATWSGVRVLAGTAPWGYLWVRIGDRDETGENNISLHRQRWDQNNPPGGSQQGSVRESWVYADAVRNIPEQFLGTWQWVRMMANRGDSAPRDDGPILDNRSGISMTLQFSEIPR